MRETPRSQETAGDPRPEPPQPRPGRALAHTTGAAGSGTPHRSDGRPPQTPRGARQTGPAGHLGTTPPVPMWPASRRSRAAVLLCLTLFALITWQVAVEGPLFLADVRLGRALFGAGPAAVTEFLADLGSTAVALPVLAAAAGHVLLREGRPWLPVLAAVAAMAAVPALVVPLKLWIARPAPLEPGTGWYPSGHTATAMVAYCGAALLVTPYLRRRWAMPVAGVLTLATGIGLVLRGYHWPLDVLGSLCLFGALLPFLNSTCRRRSSSRTRTG
ncbi:phosphatase PAP2 family protein [Streptomyces pristinaespiralis]|uniref:phosphatase PAP2 family protein n=1 Tax=Streptomyces pristinaespiralis TaxID=38300 RepID=UPI00384BED25